MPENYSTSIFADLTPALDRVRWTQTSFYKDNLLRLITVLPTGGQSLISVTIGDGIHGGSIRAIVNGEHVAVVFDAIDTSIGEASPG